MTGKKPLLLRLTLVVSVACILIPLGLIALWSVAARWAWPDILPAGLSLRGFQEVFGAHNRTFSILLSSITLSLTVAALATVIGLMTARAVALYTFRGRSLLRMGSMLPILVPGTVFAMGVHVLLIRMGLSGTVAGVILVHTICALPYTVNILADLTAAVGDRLELQAQVLGCPPGRAFLLVTLPQLLPGLLSALSMGYTISFSQYFLTLLIGGGKVKTLSILMVPFISGGDRTIASAYALLFAVSVMVVYALLERLIRRMTCANAGEGPS